MAKKKTTTKQKKGRGRQTKAEQLQNEQLKRIIWVVVLAAIMIIAYSRMGIVGLYLNRVCQYLFGRVYALILAIIVAQILISMINSQRPDSAVSNNPTAVFLIAMAVLLTASYGPGRDSSLKGMDLLQNFIDETGAIFSGASTMDLGGGFCGSFLLSLTTTAFDYVGTILIIVVLFIIAALLLVNLDVYKHAFSAIMSYLSTTEEIDDGDDDDDDDEAEVEETAPASVKEHKPLFSFLHKKKAEQPTEEEEEPVSGPAATTMANILADGDREPSVQAQPEQENSAPVQLTKAHPQDPFDIRADAPDASDLAAAKEPLNLTEIVHDAIPSDPSIFISVDDLVDRTQMIPVQPETHVEPAKNEEPAPVKPEEASEPAPAVSSLENRNPAATSQPVDTKVYTQPTENEGAVYANGMKKNRPYQLPPLRTLDPLPPKDRNDPNAAAAAQKGTQLIQVLRNFDIEARLIDTHIGPAVTKFEIRPDANVKVSRILGLADDIKMQLAVRDVRIEAPIPGHNAVGVEVPNVKAVPVKMRELIGQIPEKEKNQPLLVLLGKDLMGSTVTCRLDKMPHLLIAGATGSGKSVCMNSIICSLLLRTKPDDVKLLLVDPKKVEFTPYQKVPHLIGPVINDPTKASNALKVIVKIMEDRYDMFSKAGVRNIQGFNKMVETMDDPADGSPKPKKMPFIVVIVDEMADLMAVAGKEVESSIQRITQLARAAGIHLIVATQRPSVDVITGVIKANIPSRIAFAVSSAIDSKTILDHGGAERLLGNGDMLYMPIGASGPVRVQGVFVTDEEVQRITDFVSDEAIPMWDDSFVRLEGVNDGEGDVGGVAGADEDPLLEEVRDYVIQSQKASTSLLQRRFGIGYNRAARMIDELEQEGVIGPAQGSKPRDVYIKRDESSQG